MKNLLVFSFCPILSQNAIYIANRSSNRYNKAMRLKMIREEKHYSQKELSAILGVRQNTYSQYETGARQIPIEALIKLSAFYDVSVDYLLGLTEIEDRYSSAK